MMRIVYLNYFFDSDLRTHRQLLDRYCTMTEWCSAVRRAGDVEVIAVQRFYDPGTERVHGIDYHFVEDSFPNALKPWHNPSNVHQLVSTLRADVVHVNGPVFPVRYLRRRLPPSTAIVWQHHGGGVPVYPKSFAYRWAFAHIDGVIFTSTAQALHWKAHGAIPSHLPVCEVVESSSRLAPPPLFACRQEWSIVGSEIFLWVGRLDENKDPLTVLRGFAKAVSGLTDPHLYMAFTDDQLLPSVERLITSLSLGERVHLLGRIEHDRIASLYGAADYFVLGSHHEGSGFALIESLACGLIPIVTSIPSFMKITGNGSIGYLWEPGNADALADAIHHAVETPNAKSTIREYFDTYLSFEAIGEAALSAYSSLLQIRRSGNRMGEASSLPGSPGSINFIDGTRA